MSTKITDLRGAKVTPIHRGSVCRAGGKPSTWFPPGTRRADHLFLKERSKLCGTTRHSTSPPCGNLVDGLPHDCHTKTIAKLARLGPAKNDATLENFIELSMFWWMTLRKVHRKPCQLDQICSLVHHFSRAPVWRA